MKPAAVRPPHLDRLLARVRALDAPVVQVWAWPGSGQQAVLDALVEDARFGQPLSLDDLADPAGLAHAVNAAFEGGAHWLVLPAAPSLPGPETAAAEAVARRLGPGRRLVFASWRRHADGPLSAACVHPEELLLTGDEIAGLWSEVTGTPPGPGLVGRLAATTDGWYRPLRLAAEAAGEAGGSVEPEALLDLPAVASFLRHEVLAVLSAEERELLLRLSAGGGIGPELWREMLSPEDEAVRCRLVEVWGLGMSEGGSLRLPYLLRWFLSRERRERWPAGRRRRLAARLAAAELALERPVRALEHLVEAERKGEAARLVAASWPRLFVGASLGLLGRTFERLPELGADPDAQPAAALLRQVIEALLWQHPREATAALRRSAAARGAVAAAGRLVAAVLSLGPPEMGAGAAGGGPEKGADNGVERSELGARMPPELRPLAELVSIAAGLAAGRTGGGPDPEAAAAEALVPVLERIAAGSTPRPRDRGRVRGATPLRGLFDRALLGLFDRHPALRPALERRDDVPATWRRWLATLAPATVRGEPVGYRATLLGKPAVWLRETGAEAVELRFPLERAFLAFAYLATSPGFEASREELAEALWADDDDGAVEKNFHPTISYLRRALEPPAGSRFTGEPPLLLRRGVYRLNPRLPWSVDSAELVRWADEGRQRQADGQPELALALWREAWALYSGPLLAGHDAPWIARRREELQRRYVELLRHFGETAERLGRLTEAMDAFRTVLIEDPAQEPAHLALMRIYARQGRRDHVRRQYERLVTVLNEELGVEPMAETEETYHRLMG